MLDFDMIAKDIINHPKYKKLANEHHHGLSRYEHSLRVARSTYKITKALSLDYVSATRAALLHDFYLNEDFDDKNEFNKLKIHPEIAAENAKNYFEINDLEENAIKTHMFPLTLDLPASKEAIIMNLADTGIACYECSRFKLTGAITVLFLFIFNMITLP